MKCWNAKQQQMVPITASGDTPAVASDLWPPRTGTRVLQLGLSPARLGLRGNRGEGRKKPVGDSQELQSLFFLAGGWEIMCLSKSSLSLSEVSSNSPQTYIPLHSAFQLSKGFKESGSCPHNNLGPHLMTSER